MTFDFSDPQAGKGACDRKAATIKARMRIYLNEGNDIKNAAQLVDAMRSSGVVSGLHVTLCEMENPRTSTNVKFDGLSHLCPGLTLIRCTPNFDIQHKVSY